MGKKRKLNRALGLPPRVYFKHRGYYYVNKENKWFLLGKSFKEAMISYADLKTREIPKIFKMEQLIDRYLCEVAPKKSVSTFKQNRRQGELLKVAFEGIPPWEVTPTLVYEYMDERGVASTYSANRELSLLSHIFKKAIRWGVVRSNPCIGVEKFPEKPREFYLSDELFVSFYNYCHTHPHIQMAMDLAYMTGKRMDEILSLKFSDMQDEIVTFNIKKTSRTSLMALHDDMKAVIARGHTLHKKVKSIYVISNRKGQKYTPDGFSSIWQKLMNKALDQGAIETKFQFKDIRPKALSDTDEQHAQKLGVHTDIKTTRRFYRRKKEVVLPLKILDKTEKN